MIRTYLLRSLLLLTPLLAGCSDEEDILPEQRQNIEKFLTSSHTPRLVAEEELEAESQLPFYTTTGNFVFRYIANYYDPERGSRPEVTADAQVTITFRAYVFTFSAITERTAPFYTNDPLLKEAFGELGLTPGLWPFEPLTINLSADRIINGLRSALIGCREEDEVEVYMTYNQAYGDEFFSVIPKESPVAIFFTVDRVE